MPNKNINKSPSGLWAKHTHKPSIHWSTSSPQLDFKLSFAKDRFRILVGAASLPQRLFWRKEGKGIKRGKIREGKEGGREELFPRPPNGNYCPTDIITKPTLGGGQGPKNEIKVYLNRIS